MSKNIIICSDGTGNTAIKGRGTNVFKLFEAVDLHSHRANPDPKVPAQIAFYDDGVGTESFKPLKVLGGAVGLGLARNVRQLYRELARVYDAGDNIYLFGFSRGAFTVRTLAGMIVHCGILEGLKLNTTRDLHEAVSRTYTAYRAGYDSNLTRLLFRRTLRKPDRKTAVQRLHDEFPFHRTVPIRFIGVWDTVDAVGMPFALGKFVNRVIYQFKFPTQDLSEQVKCGCQALAIDEERTSFAPVLWQEPAKAHQKIEQVWFAGVHSNVGGGYPKQGMSLVALDWMLRQAMDCGLRVQPLDLELFQGHASVDDKLYDPRAGAGVFYRWGPRDLGTLCSANGVSPRVHLTALERIAHGTEDYAPGGIPRGVTVVTTKTGDTRADAATGTRAKAVQEVLDKALKQGPNLLQKAARPIKCGQISYWLFMLSWLALIIGAVGVTIETVPGPLTLGRIIKAVWTVVYGLITLQIDVLLETLWALLNRPWRIVGVIAFGGFSVAWWLSRRTDGRMSDIFSAFWHRQQAELREALKSARVEAAKQEQQRQAEASTPLAVR